MPEFRVYCSWRLSGVQYVVAETSDEAAELAREMALPDGDYCDDSYEVDEVNPTTARRNPRVVDHPPGSDDPEEK
jgi:hypothetical protein